MKSWKPLAIGIVAIGVTYVALVPFGPYGRGVRLTSSKEEQPGIGFKRDESAALFVGVRKFTNGGTVEVPYAADDAVDLAYLFALDPRLNLVPAHRVVLALSGRPQKEESKRHLEELEQAGAKVDDAEPGKILALVERQASIAGKGGILIVSLATHGFVRDGVPYVLGTSSLFQFSETAIPTPRIFDIAARSEARRSLIFVDACRERLTGDARSGASNPATAAPPIPIARGMERIAGQVVFFAATAGQYAYDDDRSRNGVFTKAVIDGLRCGALATRGSITAETLQTYVERRVRSWIRQNRQLSVASAIQVNIDGTAKNMPLACCSNCGRIASQPGIRAIKEGSVVKLLNANGVPGWARDVGAPIAQVETSEDEAGQVTVVVGISGKAAQHGRIVIFDREGKLLNAIEETMPLRTFTVSRLFRRKTPYILALWNDERSATSRIAIYNLDGQLFSSCEQAGNLHYLAAWLPTPRHTPKIVVAGIDDREAAVIVVLDPARVASGRPLWRGSLLPRAERIEHLEIVPAARIKDRDISFSTTGGNTFRIDFTGKVIGHHKIGRAAENTQFALASAVTGK